MDSEHFHISNGESYKKELDKLLDNYLKTLNEKELQSYKIAKEHLGTSFQLEKSVGFLQYCASTK
jgi:hypothetical protein